MKRRELFIASLGGLLVPACASAKPARRRPTPTPSQTEGPFYPEDRAPEDDADLTFVNGKPGRALGDVVFIAGTVRDDAGKPISGALVDAWQACASGRYNHSRDPNPATLDPNFQYWGRTTTDDQGRYELKTIVPGAYPASADWTRPPHIHFKISRRGYREITTQMYFAGDPLNGADRILQELSEDEQRSVVVAFAPVTGARAEAEPKARVGAFRVTLRSV